MVRPKKHLGQHFLTDPSIAARIVNSLQAPSGDTVLEIGPGTGVLTELLLEKEIRLLPVEIDHESVAHLKQKWPALEDRIIEKDFLKMDLSTHVSGPFHIIGNFPYNISSQIFFRTLEYRQQVTSVVCMIQKEVAMRIASPPGSREYGILSVLLQAYYNIEYLFSVKPGSFFPPPRVTSGVIRLSRNQTVSLSCDEKLFIKVVKSTFNQRRKMIRNSIKPILLNLDSDHELMTKRPEQLGVP
jgi:16S rRNA (adenine1518-N6/adenine1519-N6)-dimethyltransferase